MASSIFAHLLTASLPALCKPSSQTPNLRSIFSRTLRSPTASGQDVVPFTPNLPVVPGGSGAPTCFSVQVLQNFINSVSHETEMKEAERQGLGHIHRFGGWAGGFVEGREHKQLLVSAPKLQKIQGARTQGHASASHSICKLLHSGPILPPLHQTCFNRSLTRVKLKTTDLTTTACCGKRRGRVLQGKQPKCSHFLPKYSPKPAQRVLLSSSWPRTTKSRWLG